MRHFSQLGFVALCAAGLTLSACTKKSSTPETASTAATETKDAAAIVPENAAIQGIDVARKAVAINLVDEPKTLDAQKADDTIALTILNHVQEGLVRMDARNVVVPGMAESWKETSPTSYEFKLRTTNVWSDGKPVTAGDFVYAWQRGVDPKTASPYAFILFYLKNAQAINEGKMPLDQLGVKAVDDHTLVVTLENPTGFFLRVLPFATYAPSRKDIVELHGEKYAADADKIPFNGPWTITEWNHNASIKLVKNEKYWNKDAIAINEINMPYLIRDENSEYNMFKAGKYALMQTISKELLPNAQESKFQIRKYNSGTVWYLQVNTTRPTTANKNLRKAIQFALDRNEFVTQVIGIPGAKPIYGIIPEYFPGVAKSYGEEYPLSFKDSDLETAKKHLAAAKKELGVAEIPEISILASDSNTARRDMEYVQRYLKEKLGLQIKLDFQTFKVRLERSDRKDFDIVYSGWGPDYLDAMTFADLHTSWNGNNNTGWKSAELDALIKTAMSSTDAKVRLDAMAKTEEILVEDAPIIPIYQAARVYVQDPRLVGVLRRTVGPDPDFYYARIVDTVATAPAGTDAAKK